MNRLRTEFPSTLLIVLTLALAIAGNAAVFGFLDALLLKKQPGLDDPGRLVDLGATRRRFGFDQLSFPNFFDFQNENKVFSGLAAYLETPRSMSLRTTGEAERVWGVPVTGNLFDVLGAKPAIGRFFRPDDEQPGHDLVAVISHSFWERRFSGDSSAVGRQVFINARPVTIIGVAPKGFEGINYSRTDVWTPVVTEMFHTQEHPFDRGATFVFGIGRLKPGISLEQAQAEMDVVASQLEKEHPAENKDLGARLVPHNPFSVLEGSFYAFIGMLFAIAMLVLVIACANVTGVCLARSAARTREIAIRMAIGASRFRIIRQIMSETAVLFVFAGFVAALIAFWLNDWIAQLQFLLPSPIAIDLAPDVRIIGFTVFLTFLAAVVSGLVPALHAAQVDPSSAMKEEPASGAFQRSRLRSAVVVAQIALSMLLLLVGGLFVRSLSFAATVDPGLDPRHLEAISLNWFISGFSDEAGPQRLASFENSLIERVSSTPGVDSASIAVDVPMDGSGVGFNVVTVPGGPQIKPQPDWNLVSPGYFKTMRIPILRGRDFTQADHAGVAIVNETMARRYWPGQDAVGKQFYDGMPAEGRLMEVVGIAKDTNTRYVGLPADPLLYAPLEQYSYPRHYLMVRTETGESVVPVVRQILRELNPNTPIISAQSMTELMGVGLLPQRIGAWVGIIMGIIGVLLAAIGVYGVGSFSMARRTREIGVRTALGARRGDILRLILKEGVTLAVIGIAAGGVAAFALTNLIAGFLFGVSPTDSPTFIVVTGLLAAIILFASYVPARRAAKVDPMVALRHE